MFTGANKDSVAGERTLSITTGCQKFRIQWEVEKKWGGKPSQILRCLNINNADAVFFLQKSIREMFFSSTSVKFLMQT